MNEKKAMDLDEKHGVKIAFSIDYSFFSYVFISNTHPLFTAIGFVEEQSKRFWWHPSVEATTNKRC